jgi:hypothetical protein
MKRVPALLRGHTNICYVRYPNIDQHLSDAVGGKVVPNKLGDWDRRGIYYSSLS